MVANIRMVRMEDLPGLVEIENRCFTKEEAASEKTFEQRILVNQDSFFIAEIDGEIVGLVNGPVITSTYITDDLFKSSHANPLAGGHQSILGLAVSPHFQNRGIARSLLDHLEQVARSKKRETITLTCKENLIRYYEKLGFTNKGKSDSEHGGVTWYNMTKDLI